MNKKLFLFVSALMFSLTLKAQSNIMDKGFRDIVTGMTAEQLDEAIGFSGHTMTPDEFYSQYADGQTKEELPEYKNGFDRCIQYKFIMPVPVTRVFLKTDKVVMVEVSSYPDFTRPICLDSKTTQGLKFWDSKEAMEKIYGKNYRTGTSSDAQTTYFYYDAKGIGFALTNNEVRIIYFY